MTVRIGNMTFSDWVSLPFEGGWTDTFIFRIDAQACLPPFRLRPALETDGCSYTQQTVQRFDLGAGGFARRVVCGGGQHP